MVTNSMRMDSIEDALLDLKQGKAVIVVDDEDRENEGDLFAGLRRDGLTIRTIGD